MQNLYWKTAGQTRNLILKPFANEAEFEKYIFANQDLLGDVYIIYRQIRSGSKEGIADMLGVDQNARICIIEMKNVEVDEGILPQVLSYAMWAETNPDSIKAIWLESKHKPEDIELEWDNLEIRIIVVAPSFRPTVLRMASKINYPLDLVQVQRFNFEHDEFITVEVLTEPVKPKPGVTKVMGDWSWDYYEKEHGKEATDQFRKALNSMEDFVKKQGWILPYNLNKYYTGFKLGNKVIFSVNWGGTHAWNVHVKVPQETAQNFKSDNWEFQHYDNDFKEAIIRPLDRKNADIAELSSLLNAAYHHASGTR